MFPTLEAATSGVIATSLTEVVVSLAHCQRIEVCVGIIDLSLSAIKGLAL